MGLDLRYLRPSLNELILVDSCEIYRDPEGYTDDATDLATGSVLPQAGDVTLVASTVCKLKPTYRNVQIAESGEFKDIGYYELSIPGETTPVVKPGYWVKMLSSVHDPSVEGLWFRVSDFLHSTFSLFMKFRVELREAPSDRP